MRVKDDGERGFLHLDCSRTKDEGEKGENTHPRLAFSDSGRSREWARSNWFLCAWRGRTTYCYPRLPRVFAREEEEEDLGRALKGNKVNLMGWKREWVLGWGGLGIKLTFWNLVKRKEEGNKKLGLEVYLERAAEIWKQRENLFGRWAEGG